MELVVAALLVVVVVEAMIIYRFKRRADLLREAMERDRAVFMREGRPSSGRRPPEPVVRGRTAGGTSADRETPGEGGATGGGEPIEEDGPPEPGGGERDRNQ